MENGNERKIYDRRYKFYEALIEEPEFRKSLSRYKQRLSELGFPIPFEGFRSKEDADAWEARVHRGFINKQDDLNYAYEERLITGGKATWGLKQQREIEALEQRLLPPYPWHEPLKKILSEHIKHRKSDRQDLEFITQYVKYNSINYSCALMGFKTVISDNGERELWIRIYPQTRKEDIVRDWKLIKMEQERLPGYKKRLRKSTGPRDPDLQSSVASRVAKSRLKKQLKENENQQV